MQIISYSDVRDLIIILRRFAKKYEKQYLQTCMVNYMSEHNYSKNNRSSYSHILN